MDIFPFKYLFLIRFWRLYKKFLAFSVVLLNKIAERPHYMKVNVKWCDKSNKGGESLFVVFSFLFLFNCPVFGDVLSFFLSSGLFILLILFFKSVFDGLIGIVPHSADNLGQLCDLRLWIIIFDLVVHFSSEQKEGWKSSFRSSRLHNM